MKRATEVVQKNPLITLMATLIASGGLSATVFEKFGGGADAKAGIAAIVEVTESQLKAANAERDRTIDALDEMLALYLDCNAARLRSVP